MIERDWPDVPENILDCESCHEPHPEDELNAYGYCGECRDEFATHPHHDEDNDEGLT